MYFSIQKECKNMSDDKDPRGKLEFENQDKLVVYSSCDNITSIIDLTLRNGTVLNTGLLVNILFS